jgi:hypothetical protein
LAASFVASQFDYDFFGLTGGQQTERWSIASVGSVALFETCISCMTEHFQPLDLAYAQTRVLLQRCSVM